MSRKLYWNDCQDTDCVTFRPPSVWNAAPKTKRGWPPPRVCDRSPPLLWRSRSNRDGERGFCRRIPEIQGRGRNSSVSDDGSALSVLEIAFGDCARPSFMQIDCRKTDRLRVKGKECTSCSANELNATVYGCGGVLATDELLSIYIVYNYTECVEHFDELTSEQILIFNN